MNVTDNAQLDLRDCTDDEAAAEIARLWTEERPGSLTVSKVADMIGAAAEGDRALRVSRMVLNNLDAQGRPDSERPWDGWSRADIIDALVAEAASGDGEVVDVGEIRWRARVDSSTAAAAHTAATEQLEAEAAVRYWDAAERALESLSDYLAEAKHGDPAGVNKAREVVKAERMHHVDRERRRRNHLRGGA